MAMTVYLLRRFVTMALTLLMISAIVFLVIKLPPGDYLSNQIDELRAQGDAAAAAKAEFLRVQYGLDRPVVGAIPRLDRPHARTERILRASRRAIGAGPSNSSGPSTKSWAVRSA